MKNSLKQSALALALIAMQALSGPAFASSSSVPNDKAEQIRATLTEQGYEVRKIDMEDGNFEAYAIKDGKKFEIYMDANLKVIQTISAD